MTERYFSDVKLYAVQKPEDHRTVQSDRSVLTEQLPGTLEVGFVIDGVRVPLMRRKAGGVLADIERHKQAQAASADPTE